MRLFRHELRIELLLYTRSRELAFFTFLLPLILFVLLGSVYGNDTVKGDPGVKQSKYLEAGMIGYGAISIAFAGLAIVLVIRRESGVLKRLRATPLPAWAYIAARALLVCWPPLRSRSPACSLSAGSSSASAYPTTWDRSPSRCSSA